MPHTFQHFSKLPACSKGPPRSKGKMPLKEMHPYGLSRGIDRVNLCYVSHISGQGTFAMALQNKQFQPREEHRSHYLYNLEQLCVMRVKKSEQYPNKQGTPLTGMQAAKRCVNQWFYKISCHCLITWKRLAIDLEGPHGGAVTPVYAAACRAQTPKAAEKRACFCANKDTLTEPPKQVALCKAG